MSTKKHIARFGAVAAAAAALAAPLVTATPASASGYPTYYVSDNCAVHPTYCYYGSINGLTLYYNSIIPGYPYASGSTATFASSVYNYAGDTVSNIKYVYIFQQNFGNGSGQAVKNNAAAVSTCGALDNYRVYYNSGYAGHSQTFPKNNCAYDYNLDSTLKNNNASQHIA